MTYPRQEVDQLRDDPRRLGVALQEVRQDEATGGRREGRAEGEAGLVGRQEPDPILGVSAETAVQACEFVVQYNAMQVVDE